VKILRESRAPNAEVSAMPTHGIDLTEEILELERKRNAVIAPPRFPAQGWQGCGRDEKANS